jgi:hypothetical protein
MKIRHHLRQQHFIKNHAVLDESLRQSIRLFLDAVLAKDRAMEAYQRVMAYALLYNRDLSCILEDLDDPASPAHANLYARLAIVLADECFGKMPTLTGKDLRAALKAWKTLSHCGREFRKLKKADGRWVADLRDNVLAHRDLAVAKQWRLIHQLDVQRATAVATGLLSWTTSLYSVLNDVVAARVAYIREHGPDA